MAGVSSTFRLLQRRQLSNISNFIKKQSNFAAVRVSTPKVKVLATLHGKGSNVEGQKDFRRHDSNCAKRTDLNFDDILTLLGNGNLQLIDVREPNELAQQGEFPSALNIPREYPISTRGCVTSYHCPDRGIPDLKRRMRQGNLTPVKSMDLPVQVKKKSDLHSGEKILSWQSIFSCLKESLMLKDERFIELFNIPKPRPNDEDIVFVGFGPIKSSTALEIAHKMGFKKVFEVGQLESALNMAPHTFKALYGCDKPDLLDDNIVFACYAGIRSLKAMSIAHEIGYLKARQYTGGFKEWLEKTEEITN